MKPEISFLLTVRDAEASLAGTVAHALEILSDVAERFEIVVADEGSADETAHVAGELAACFPQVRRVGSHGPNGRESAVLAAVKSSESPRILLCRRPDRLDVHHLRMLLKQASDHEAVIGRVSPPAAGAAMRSKEELSIDYLLIDRNVLCRIPQLHPEAERLTKQLQQWELRWCEVPIMRRKPAASRPQAHAAARQPRLHVPLASAGEPGRRYNSTMIAIPLAAVEPD